MCAASHSGATAAWAASVQLGARTHKRAARRGSLPVGEGEIVGAALVLAVGDTPTLLDLVEGPRLRIDQTIAIYGLLSFGRSTWPRR